MIKIATPISDLFDNELMANEIMARSNCLECRERSSMFKAPGQFLFHCEQNIVCLWDGHERSSIYSLISAKRELQLVSFHMAASCSEPVLTQGIYHSGGLVFTEEEMLNNARLNIAWLRTWLEDNIEIAVENNNYYSTPAYRHITDGSFISRVVHENGLRLLFDSAHARITAYNKGINYSEYRASLPLDRMIQIHISKHGINERNIAYDAHELPDETVFEELIGIVSLYPLKYLTVEYYKDPCELLKVLDYCQTIIKRVE